MKLSKKAIVIIVTVLILSIGGGLAYATSTPTVRAEHQLNLGNKYLQEGKYKEAILAFEKVIQIDQKNIPARLGLGNAYIATKDYAKAETVLKEVVEIDKNNISARELLFKVYLNTEKFDLAISILKEITTTDPQKDVKKLNSDLETTKALSASQASYKQGIKQMGDNKFKDAIESFQKVIKEDNERYDSAQLRISECKKIFIDLNIPQAKALIDTNDIQTALMILDDILKVDSTCQEAISLKEKYQPKPVVFTNPTEEQVKKDIVGRTFTCGNRAFTGYYSWTIKSGDIKSLTIRKTDNLQSDVLSVIADIALDNGLYTAKGPLEIIYIHGPSGWVVRDIDNYYNLIEIPYAQLIAREAT